MNTPNVRLRLLWFLAWSDAVSDIHLDFNKEISTYKSQINFNLQFFMCQ